MILASAAVVLAGAFVFIREQTAIGDRAFLRSMIPNHSGGPDVPGSPAQRP